MASFKKKNNITQKSPPFLTDLQIFFFSPSIFLFEDVCTRGTFHLSSFLLFAEICKKKTKKNFFFQRGDADGQNSIFYLLLIGQIENYYLSHFVRRHPEGVIVSTVAPCTFNSTYFIFFSNFEKKKNVGKRKCVEIINRVAYAKVTRAHEDWVCK